MEYGESTLLWWRGGRIVRYYGGGCRIVRYYGGGCRIVRHYGGGCRIVRHYGGGVVIELWMRDMNVTIFAVAVFCG